MISNEFRIAMFMAVYLVRVLRGFVHYSSHFEILEGGRYDQLKYKLPFMSNFLILLHYVFPPNFKIQIVSINHSLFVNGD